MVHLCDLPQYPQAQPAASAALCPGSILAPSLTWRDPPHLERSPTQDEMGVSGTLWTSNSPTPPGPFPLLVGLLSSSFSWPRACAAAREGGLGGESPLHASPAGPGQMASVHGAPSTTCLLGPWASDSWGWGVGGAETDRPGDSAVQGVEAAEWQRRPQQITFLSRPRSKNGWVVFSGLSL